MSPCRLLVVDDDEHIRDALADILSDEGYVIDTANQGQDALDRLRSTDTLPDLILLDLMMPVMDGTELLKRLKADPRLAGIPVVVLTAMGQRATVTTADAVFAKPVDLNALLEQIQRLCRR
jgi:CheY-like chemotaxis protein